MKRYGNVDYILKCPFETGIMFIKKALEEEKDSIIWQMWLSVYPHMTEKTFISYSDYKKRLLKSSEASSHQQTDEEMMAMCKMLNAAFGGTVVET